MKNYWFSFSYKGKNNGVCIVQADTRGSAEDKLENLKLIPDYDDVACYEIDDISDEDGLDFNILYSTEEMIAKGYSITES